MVGNNSIQNDDAKYVRIKRLREDEGFQALLVEEVDTKTNKDNIDKPKRKYIYKRIKFNDNNINENTPILEKTSNNKFVYKKKRRRSSYDLDDNQDSKNIIQKYTDESLPHEVNSLLSDLLSKEINMNKNVKNPESKKLLLKNGKKLKLERELKHKEPTNVDSGYVYDVYIKEEINDEYDFENNFSNVAYLKIVEDGALVYDEEVTDDKFSDDEDSNEEDYYRNDYPEDEDDDRSVLFGDEYDEGEETYYGGRRNSGAFDEIEAEQINDYVDYDDFSENMGRYSNNLNSGNFLDSINKNPYNSMLKNGELITDEDSSDDAAYYFTDEEDAVSDGDATHDLSGEFSFPRNQFFATDQDDPMAVYRDKIMYNLEKQIKKASKR